MHAYKMVKEITLIFQKDQIYKNYRILESICIEFVGQLGTNIKCIGPKEITYKHQANTENLTFEGFVSSRTAREINSINNLIQHRNCTSAEMAWLTINSIRECNDEQSYNVYDHFVILCFLLGLPVHIREGVTRKRIELDISTLNSIKYDPYHMDIERGELKYFLEMRNLPLPHSLYEDAQINTQVIHEELAKPGWDNTFNLDDIRKVHSCDQKCGKIDVIVLKKMLQDDTRNYFLFYSSQWYIKFNGKLFTSRDRDGWRYIYFLIKHKNERYFAADLSDNFLHLLSLRSLQKNVKINMAKEEDAADAQLNIADTDQEMIDLKYKKNLNNEINSLTDKIKTSPDPEERASMRKKIANLKKILYSSTIPGGGGKPFAADREKKRKRVSKVITKAIDSIGPDFVEIRDHLRDKIHTGTEMYYFCGAEEWITDVPTQ